VGAAPGLGFVFHIAQGFETELGGEPSLVLDVAHFKHYPTLPSLTTVGEFPPIEPSRLARVVVPLGARGSLAHVASQSRGYAEFPITGLDVAAQGQRIVWALASPARDPMCLSCLGRFDRETGIERLKEFAPDVPSPPTFAQGRSSPAGEGFILTTVYRAHEGRSDLLVLAAETLDVLATFALPQALPPSFHGTFLPA
jgi:carotenoid cleavage dioxygenase-like enzyme